MQTIITNLKNDGITEFTQDGKFVIYGTNGDDKLPVELLPVGFLFPPGSSIAAMAGQGNDTLRGGSGNDIFDGGDGDDTAIFQAKKEDISVNHLDGSKYIITSGKDGSDVVSSVELFYFDGQLVNLSDLIVNNSVDRAFLAARYTTEFASAPTMDDTALAQYFIGMGKTVSNAGSDILTGGEGPDVLYAGPGKDKITSGAGHDYVDAGSDNDLIIAGEGAGDDTYIGGTGVDKIKYTSAITGILVNLALGTANGNEIGSDLLSFIENIIGGQSDDTLTGDDNANTIRGYTGNDTISGGVGNDILFGESGDDVEIGGDSDDILWGISGNNTLDGGSGNDQLISGEGYNILTGGAGTDSFLFSSATHSTITDFNSTDDLIQLEKNVFTNLKTLGTLDIANFVIGSSALDENDYVIYNSITGELFYDADGNGVQTPIQLATLSTNLALTNNNFVITDTNVGNDTIIGSISKDILKGGFGNDTINAKAGNDVLIGGAGQDNLTGGLGADKFKFNNILETGITETTRDTIIDFKTTQADKIDLSAIHANLALTENSAFLIFNQGSAFSGSFSAAAELFFDQTTQILWGNNNDDLAADFSILLTGVSSLALSDFIL